MKNIALIIVLLFSISCKSQLTPEKISVEERSELKPPFSNQGEQEDYWAQELFKNEYKREYYPNYSGVIKASGSKIQFGEDQFINFNDSTSNYKLIFEDGLFYPGILSATNLTIGNLEELEFLSKSPKVKRFRFWMYYEDFANPQVFLFELINEKANHKTDWKTFIKGARLTFVKAGWTII